MYETNYDCITKNEDFIEYRRESCFSAIYDNIEECDSIIVYIKKDTKKRTYCGYDYQQKFTEEEIINYIGALNKMHLFCYLDLECKTIIDEKECYSFEIDCQRNNILRVKMLLNVIRYLYENSSYSTPSKIVEHFLEYINKESDISLWNLFALANTTSKCTSSGHNFVPNYGSIKPLSDEEYEKLIINNKENIYNVSYSIPQTKKKVKLEKEENLIQLYQKFEKLCEEYI